jgi:hypothetical protein
MTNRPNPVRRYSRFPVRWPMLYGSDELIAEGTVLDLTSLGWRLAGSMPVVPGMQLTLQVSIPERSTPLRIQRATVLWVKDHEFAIEAHEMPHIDHAWVAEFLNQKLGLMWMSRTADQETSVHPRDEMTHSETALSQSSAPFIEDLQRQLSVFHTDSTDMSAEAHWTNNSDFQDQDIESRSPFVRLPETIFLEARRIVRRMLAIKATRARTGRDPIANN